MECPFCNQEERCRHLVFVTREFVSEEWVNADYEHELFAPVPDTHAVHAILSGLAKGDSSCPGYYYKAAGLPQGNGRSPGYYYKTAGLMEEEMGEVPSDVGYDCDEDGEPVYEEVVVLRSWYLYVAAPAEFCDWVRQWTEGKSAA